MISKQQITDLANSSLQGSNIFLVKVSVGSGNKISVTLDSDSSVSIDDCIQTSRFIENKLDREVEDFELNVSSAGIGQPLILDRQFIKYIDKEVSVLTTEGKKLKGILIQKLDDKIKLRIPANKKKKTKEQHIEILLGNIKETKGVISFKKK